MPVGSQLREGSRGAEAVAFERRLDLFDAVRVAGQDLGLGLRDPGLGGGIGEQFCRRFDGLGVFY
jgi:hypothetical protein